MIFGRSSSDQITNRYSRSASKRLSLMKIFPRKALKLIPWARESGGLVLLVHNWTVEDGLASASIAGMEVCDPSVHPDFTAADTELVRQHRT